MEKFNLKLEKFKFKIVKLLFKFEKCQTRVENVLAVELGDVSQADNQIALNLKKFKLNGEIPNMGRKCTDFGDVSQADKALSDSYWKTFANCSIRLSLNWKTIANWRSTKHGRKIPSMNNVCTIDGAIFQFACN